MDEINAALDNLSAMKDGKDPRQTCPECDEMVDKLLQDDDNRVALGRESGKSAACVICPHCANRVVPTGDGLEQIDLDAGFQ